jgi:hypothetical protein
MIGTCSDWYFDGCLLLYPSPLLCVFQLFEGGFFLLFQCRACVLKAGHLRLRAVFHCIAITGRAIDLYNLCIDWLFLYILLASDWLFILFFEGPTDLVLPSGPGDLVAQAPSSNFGRRS